MGKHAVTASFVALVIVVAAARVADAQPWTPEAKTLDLDATYQLGYATRTENVEMTIIHHLFIPTVEYGVTDNLAVSASVPVIVLKAEGGNTHGSWDNNGYHNTTTDARVNARYMIPLDVFAITPQIGASVPTREYEVLGNAAAGRHLKAGYAGLSIGADLDSEIPRTAIVLAYEFALVEKYKDAGAEGEAIDQNYSVFNAQIVHHIAGLQMHAGLDYHYHHGGITFDEFGMLTDLERMHHDPLLRERALLVGGGLSYDINEHASMYATTRIFVTGENTQNASLFAVGASWDFSL
jgi:hypothetical protein